MYRFISCIVGVDAGYSPPQHFSTETALLSIHNYLVLLVVVGR